MAKGQNLLLELTNLLDENEKQSPKSGLSLEDWKLLSPKLGVDNKFEFSVLDRNRDGRLDLDEIQAIFQPEATNVFVILTIILGAIVLFIGGKHLYERHKRKNYKPMDEYAPMTSQLSDTSEDDEEDLVEKSGFAKVYS